ncbi:MAG TPA: YXWGXW repeat-containing protein [Rhizomicrobium sp.]|nr:YXWGXW repeat-containing protein [Rhizomicrobium sp.]
MKRSIRIAGALTAALMASAPLMFAPTAASAATANHEQFRGGAKQVALYGKYRDGKAGRDANYDRDGRHDGRHHRYTDRAHRPALRFEAIALQIRPGFVFHAGHWTWQVNHWHWIAGSWQHR